MVKLENSTNIHLSVKDSLKDHKYRSFSVLFLVIISAVLEGTFIFFFKSFFEKINSDSTTQLSQILIPFFVISSIWIFQALLNLVVGFTRTWLEIKYSKKGLVLIYNKLSLVKQEILDNSSTGEIVGKAIEDSKVAFMGFLYPLTDIITSFFLFSATFIALCIISWLPSLIVLVISLVIGLLTFTASIQLAKLQEQARERSSGLWGIFYNSFKNIKFIKSNNMQTKYSEEVAAKVYDYREATKKSRNFRTFWQTIQEILFGLSWLSTAIVGAIFYFDNQAYGMSAAALVTFTSSSQMLRGPIARILEEIQSFNEIKVSYKRLNSILELEDERYVENNITKSGNSITFQNVSFSYFNGLEILKEASFSFESGHKYAIVGKTGSGKSTIFDLIVGLYSPYKGIIKIGGIEINNDSKWSIRNSISLAYQLPFLVESTIEENIKLLNPDLSNDELQNILDICDVRSIVEKQDRGLQCKIGENGVQLSVGERKRIQIAQTIAKKADIYMFDELTASLDAKTAKCIMKSISSHLKDKTVIFIEHRLEMIDGIKEIYEFKNNTLIKAQ